MQTLVNAANQFLGQALCDAYLGPAGITKSMKLLTRLTAAGHAVGLTALRIIPAILASKTLRTPVFGAASLALAKLTGIHATPEQLGAVMGLVMAASYIEAPGEPTDGE